MTKGEINSLQTLARAGGGSLTINPHTGLTEAGFLSKLLPMAAGAAAMYFSGGTAAPLIAGMSNAATIGLGMGAFETARTGSLNKGLMAGLGAYGGAGLAGGMMGAGAAEIGKTAATDAVQEAGKQGLTGEAYNQSIQNSVADKMGGLSNFDKLSAGFNNPAATMNAMGGGAGVLRTGLAATAPMMMGGDQQPQTPVGDSTMPQRLKYNPGAATTTPMPDVPGYDNLGQDFGRQRSYFPNAGYEQITPEQAKQMRGYAGGGPVEAMSNANAIGANTGYPMADINKATYSTPYQTPQSQNVVQGDADTGVNSMTGEINEFAAGGDVQLQGRVTIDDQGSQGGQFGKALGNGYRPMGGGVDAGFDMMNTGTYSPSNSPLSSALHSMQRAAYNPNNQTPYDGQAPASQGPGSYGGGNFNPFQRQTPQTYEEYASSPTQEVKMPREQFEAQQNQINQQRQQGMNMLGGQYGQANPFSDAMPQGMAQRNLQMAMQQGGSVPPANDPYATPLLRHCGIGMATGGTAYAQGGMSHLGDYSDGGRLLKGPGDGVSDSIPATIGNKRPARLADGEFVVPARIVSELGNGSTEAGARKLYAMLDRVQSARKKSIGKGKVAKNSRADKLLPA
jgi:hypothetical protein